MMNLKTFLVLAGIVVAAIWVLRTQSRDPFDNLPEPLRQAARQSKADLDGPLGQSAREQCSRKLGIKASLESGSQVAAQYGAQKAIEFSECVIETMYPTR
jgi:hypothetical protein